MALSSSRERGSPMRGRSRCVEVSRHKGTTAAINSQVRLSRRVAGGARRIAERVHPKSRNPTDSCRRFHRRRTQSRHTLGKQECSVVVEADRRAHLALNPPAPAYELALNRNSSPVRSVGQTYRPRQHMACSRRAHWTPRDHRQCRNRPTRQQQPNR